MNRKFSKRSVLVLMLLLCLMLTACGKKGADASAEGEEGEETELEPIELPEEYELGEGTVVALLQQHNIVVTAEEVEGGVAYTYTGLVDPKNECAEYAQCLLTDEDPFVAVAEDFVPDAVPDFTQPEGNALYARASETSGMLSLIRLEWDEEKCVVTVYTQEGEITTPEPITLAEALDYIKTLAPSQLGLDGTSMSEYEVYALDGSATVDGRPCLRLKVCSTNNASKTNLPVGTYLLTGDKRHLYSLDEVNRKVTEIKIQAS
jgi:hypothetical protein